METITGFFTFLILLTVLLIIAAVLYKCRGDISTWLNARSAPADYSARKVALKRRLEDAERIAERKTEDVEVLLDKIKKKESQAAEAETQEEK